MSGCQDVYDDDDNNDNDDSNPLLLILVLESSKPKHIMFSTQITITN